MGKAEQGKARNPVPRPPTGPGCLFLYLVSHISAQATFVITLGFIRHLVKL